MTQLPKFTWDVDPVFLRVPRELVIGALGAFALVSLFIGLRKKASDQLLTAVIFGALAFIAQRFLKGEYELRYYSVLFLGVFLGGYSLLKWQIVRGGGRAEDAGDFIVYGVLGVLVGARLGHVLFYDLDKALEDPAWILQVWTGGLASHGAVLGLITAMWLFTKRRGIAFLEGADRFAFSAALGATLVRIGNLFNSEIVGRKVPDQSWGVWFPRNDREEVYRYPTQFYEITLGLVTMLALYLVDRGLGREKRPRGALIATFFAVYFPGRFLIEFFKEFEGISPDSPLTMGQYLSLPGILIGWFGLFLALKRKVPVGWPGGRYEDEDGDGGEEAPESARPSGRRRKRKKAKKAKRAREAAAATSAAAAEKPAAEEPEEEDEGSEPEREEPARRSDPGTSSEGEDEDEDEDERDARPGDPDVDDEFDEQGKLKRKNKPEE